MMSGCFDRETFEGWRSGMSWTSAASRTPPHRVEAGVQYVCKAMRYGARKGLDRSSPDQLQQTFSDGIRTAILWVARIGFSVQAFSSRGACLSIIWVLVQREGVEGDLLFGVRLIDGSVRVFPEWSSISSSQRWSLWWMVWWTDEWYVVMSERSGSKPTNSPRSRPRKGLVGFMSSQADCDKVSRRPAGYSSRYLLWSDPAFELHNWQQRPAG